MQIDAKLAEGYVILCNRKDEEHIFIVRSLGPAVECPKCGNTALSGDLATDHIRKVIEDGVEALKGCHFDICLKDVETVEHQPQRLKDWVRIAREVVDNHT